MSSEQFQPLKLAAKFAGHQETSPTLRINEQVQQMWAAGETVYHLGFGESRMPLHPKLLATYQEHAHQKSYLAGQGLAKLREEIAGFYQRTFQIPTAAHQVMVGPGSKSLIFALQMALDAELILPTPSWVSYSPQAELLGQPVQHIPATMRDNYMLTIEALDQTLANSTNRSKLLLINSPNNPSGQMFSESLLRELADYCREQGITVISDEIYGRVTLGSKPHISISRYYPEGTIVLGGLSKHLGLGGWRLGVAVLPDTPEGAALMQAVRVIASEIWSSPTSAVQYAATVAYGDDPEITHYIDQCNALHSLRTRHLWSWLTELGIECTEPEGGFYLVANFDRWREPLAAMGITTSEDLTTHLLQEYQIAALPGTTFGIPAAELSIRLASSYVDMESDDKAEAVFSAFQEGVDGEVLMQAHHPMMNGAIERFGRFVENLG